MSRWASTLTALALVVFTQVQAADKNVVRIGAIFPRGFEASESAFRSALKRSTMNSDRYEFTPIIVKPADVDSLTLYNAACDLLNTEYGISALFVRTGDDSGRAIAVVENLIARAGIPLLQGEWRPPVQTNNIYPQATFNYYPDAKTTSSALAALVKDFDWDAFTVLYDDDFGLIELQEVLKTRPFPNSPLTIRKLSRFGDNVAMLKEIQKSGETRIMLDCAAERAHIYLEQAISVNLMGEYQTFLLSSLNTHTVDIPQPDESTRSNVTSLRFIETNEPNLKYELYQWREEANERGYRYAFPEESNRTQVETALAADAVRHLVKAIETLLSPPRTAMSCPSLESEMSYPDNPLFEEMLKTSIKGLSGHIEFVNATSPRRTNVSFAVFESSQTGLYKTAEWHSGYKEGESRLNLTQEGQEGQRIDAQAQNKIFRVVSKKGLPWLENRTWPEGEEPQPGDDIYVGFVPDFMKTMAAELGIKYQIETVTDYGKYDAQKNKWTGLIEKLMLRNADLAIGDLSITSERRRAVDFTSPFMNLGISILFRKPVEKPSEPYSFLKPFSFKVWIYVATAYLAVSITLFIVARISPADWESPHPCFKETEELENIWHLKNCTWLTMGSIMTQGSDILPKAVGTRWVTGLWWFFTLIMTSSYTANMAAFLSDEQSENQIKSAEDLSTQNKVKYGAVEDGSTANFFKFSNESVYKRMWAAMDSDHSVFLKNNQEAAERVLKEKSTFAFLMESTSIEYFVERYCDLQQVGRLLDNKGYGIAMPVNSPYRAKFDQAVLRMAESGKIQKIKDLWWKDKEGGMNKCANKGSGDSQSMSNLDVKNVGGVFLVVGAGAALSCVVAAIELLWHVRDIVVTENISQSEALKAELKFSLNIFRGLKPVLNKSSQSSSSSESRSRTRSRSRAHSILRAATSFINLEKVY